MTALAAVRHDAPVASIWELHPHEFRAHLAAARCNGGFTRAMRGLRLVARTVEGCDRSFRAFVLRGRLQQMGAELTLS